MLNKPGRPVWGAALLRWYGMHRRPLPWRENRDPYRIWVSEVMLQQTQVATATPHYRAFLARFPSLERLASARLDQVLAAWSGLGYYRRARNLHAAARQVVREHGGVVPRDPAAFERLPGVGRYTTGAVLSISFDLPLPVLDGNVARVLSRFEALSFSVREPRGARELWARAAALVPARGAGDWNQALMELGATVCKPVAPACERCPVRRWCRAHALGRVEEFPPVEARRATEAVRRAVAVIERDGKLLVAKRGRGVLEGLWEPPGVEIDPARASRTPSTEHARVRRALAAELSRLGITARLERSDLEVRHTITHRRITVEMWRGALAPATQRAATWRWVDPETPRIALTALAKACAGQWCVAAPRVRRS
ncbi:MAG: A/G-specific adenine glycosylase [Candidatus Eisenbacteria bacterium]|uniref:Adenine DNA glycosylase n=1 Tax=Eiseniibacteriota bacterium TaxID=2212470 RepID=A0A849SU70_UNCEI|nr:A/G-specific adenine glycosylase [Candidatus Eisenbacteria bacterium]